MGITKLLLFFLIYTNACISTASVHVKSVLTYCMAMCIGNSGDEISRSINKLLPLHGASPLLQMEYRLATLLAAYRTRDYAQCSRAMTYFVAIKRHLNSQKMAPVYFL